MMQRKLPRPDIIGKTLFFKPKSRIVRNHLRAWALKTVDKSQTVANEYSQKTHWIRRIADRIPDKVLQILDPVLFLGLRATRRNGLIFERDGKVISHVIFQRHGNSLHVYSIWVEPGLQGQGIGTEATEHFLEYAKDQKGIKRVRIGGGRNPKINKIYEKLALRSNELKINPVEGYWFELNDK